MKVINSSGEYAFLMESNSIQYQIERNCDLIQVGTRQALNDGQIYNYKILIGVHLGGQASGLEGLRDRVHPRLPLQV